MMMFVKSPQGLKFVCSDYNLTAIELITCLLETAGVQYVKGQVKNGEIFFKVEPQDQSKIENLIQGWTTTATDIQYSLANSVKQP